MCIIPSRLSYEEQAKEQAARIKILRDKLIERHGYNEQSAQDVIDHVGGLFAGKTGLWK